MAAHLTRRRFLLTAASAAVTLLPSSGRPEKLAQRKISLGRSLALPQRKDHLRFT